MRRLSHDAPGIGQRIDKAYEKLQTAMIEVQDVWKDDRSRDFFQRYTTEIPTTIKQLTSTLTTTIESFEGIAKQMQDPDRQ